MQLLVNKQGALNKVVSLENYITTDSESEKPILREDDLIIR